VTWREPNPEAYLAAIHRGFQFARELGRRCGPLHLLVGIAEGDDQAAAALVPASGPSLRTVVRGAADDTFGNSAGYLQLQAQEAARLLAAELGSEPAPGHLLIALLDQGTPDVLRTLSLARLDPAAVRQAAAAAAGAPAGLAPVALPAPVPAGTMDRPALPVEELDKRAWAALRWRQEHLPLGMVRSRGDLEALGNLERGAALRVAGSLGLDDDQRYSLLSRHDAEVTGRALTAHPDLGAGPRWAPRRHIGRRWACLLAGWGVWFGNRRVGVRDRWFRLRTRASYRGSSGVSHGRHTLSWNAASATDVTPASSSCSSTPKNTGRVRIVSSSSAAGRKPGAAACTIPSLISSRQIAGQPTARAISCASVVLPEPAGPLKTISVGTGERRIRSEYLTGKPSLRLSRAAGR
jgi:hypothetical protein